MSIDWLRVSGNHCIYGIGADDNSTAYFAPYSKAMRDKVSKYGVYVDCTGGIRTPETTESFLGQQVCYLVGISRLLVTDKSFLHSHFF